MMISRFPTNTLLSIISHRCNSIIKSKPIDFTTKTNVYSTYNIESTFLEKYIDQEKIGNINFTNIINNRLIINKGYDHTSTNYNLMSVSELDIKIDNITYKINEHINVDLRTNQMAIMHYKLFVDDKNIIKFTKKNYEEGYKVKQKDNIIEIFNNINNQINK
jgi:hypothetical protein